MISTDREITKKTSVASALDDKQKTIEKLLQYGVARESTHHVLQIRTSLFSNAWQHDWKLAQKNLYKQPA